jgi:hypothetical protein
VFQGVLRHTLVGDGLGVYYFKIDEITGQISVAQNLRTGRDMVYMVRSLSLKP